MENLVSRVADCIENTWRKDNETMKVIVFSIFAILGWLGAAWSSGLWDGKEGFLWGLLASGLFDFSVSLISGSSKQAWDDLTKNNSAKGALGTVLNMAFAAVAAFAGYNVLLLGWHHWWTGFWASTLLGLPGLVIGILAVVVSIIHFLLSIVPRKFWGKYVK